MKTRILSLILILLLCLTAGCGKALQDSEKPDGISSSESKTEESSAMESSQEEEQTLAQTAEQQSADATDSIPTEEAESDNQTRAVLERPKTSTTPPQASEPQQDKVESVSWSETPSLTVPQQPVVEKTTEPSEATPQPTEVPAQPTEQPQEEPIEQPQEVVAEPAFDIGYWISFAQSYAESVGLTLDSGAAYCWDNPIAAGSKCNCTERDIKGYLNRYAKDGDITDVWIWYEQVSDNYFEVYIGYA